MRHFFITLIVLIFLAGCTPGSPQAQQATATPLPVPTAAERESFTVARGDITELLQFSARVVPAVQEELYFRTPGRVRKVYVKPGDMVTQGQVLADLLQVDEMEARQQQQALALRRAEISVAMAELRQQMFATQTPNWVAGYDIEAKMKAYEVELAQITLEEARLNSSDLTAALDDARIIAPIDGKVLMVQALEGSEVKAFTPLIRVADDSTLEIGASLSNTEMKNLSEGMPVTVSPTSRPGEKLAGTLRALPYPFGSSGGKTTADRSGSTSSDTTRVSLDDPALLNKFKLGDLMTVVVITAQRKDVLWLPPQAVRAYEGRSFVVVKVNNQQKRVDVKLGLQNESMVEVIEGLEEGQVVIAP